MLDGRQQTRECTEGSQCTRGQGANYPYLYAINISPSVLHYQIYGGSALPDEAGLYQSWSWSHKSPCGQVKCINIYHLNQLPSI